MTKRDRCWWFSSGVIAGYAVAVGSVVVAFAVSLLLNTVPYHSGIAVCLRRIA
jgi:hypothetical protein